MKVKYQAFRKGGVDMTGKVIDMDDTEAAILIKSNIVVPVGDIETTSIEPPSNMILKRAKPRRKANGISS